MPLQNHCHFVFNYNHYYIRNYICKKVTEKLTRVKIQLILYYLIYNY